MFVTKYRPGAGSGNRRNRTIEDTETRTEGHGTPRPFAEDAGGRREAETALRESEQAKCKTQTN